MNNYFVIEQDNYYVDNVVLLYTEGNVLYEELMDMSYEEMKAYDRLEDFLFSAHEVLNEKDTLISLVNEEDTLVWGILFGSDSENKEYLRYVFIDWGIDGKVYKYQKED